MMLWKVALAGGTVELAPGAAIGMAVGAQVAGAQPAPIGTVGVRAKMHRGIHLTRAPVRRGQRLGAHRRRWRELGGLVFTEGTRGLLRQARKRCGLAGGLTRGLDELR